LRIGRRGETEDWLVAERFPRGKEVRIF